jgi:tRNA(Arg) A34 adenosine deaminase TadA
MTTSNPSPPRRSVLARLVLATALLLGVRPASSAERSDPPPKPEQRWFEAAASMKHLAESRGDQPYGAVLVANGSIIGEGPSRVIERGDPTAHAEREAIRDAQRRLGRTNLSGSVLYSTSRPCRQCELAAAQARVARMIYGAELNDAGQPGS